MIVERLWFAVSLVVAVAALGTAVIVAGRALRRSGGQEDAAGTVGVALWVAGAWAVMGAVGAVIAVLGALLQPDVTITMPVAEFWPALPAGTALEGMTATRVSGGFTSVDLTVTGLSTGARILWAVSQGLAWLLPTAIAVLIAVTCAQLRAGRAFAPAVSRMTMITAVVVAAGGVAMQVTGDIAGSMAAVETLQWTSGSYPDLPGIEDVPQAWWPRPGFFVTFPFWPIAAGLAFAALAAVFRIGSRLQRDTAGLV